MRKTFSLVAVVALLVAGASGCTSAKLACPGLTGLPQTACEWQALVSQIETYQPKAFAALDAVKAVVTPDLAARIQIAQNVWPSLKQAMDSSVEALNAGSAKDVTQIVAKATAFYVDLSALLVECGGKPLPGLAATATIHAVRAAP